MSKGAAMKKLLVSLALGCLLLAPVGAAEIPHYDEAKTAVAAGRTQEALQLFARGAQACKAAGDTMGEALCLYEMGVIHYDRKELELALSHFSQALPAFEQARVATAVEMIHYRSGLAHAALGHYDPAIADLEATIKSARERHEATRTRQVLVQLGRVQHLAWHVGGQVGIHLCLVGHVHPLVRVGEDEAVHAHHDR